MVDGVPAAKIRHGQRVGLPVPSGPHELLLKISWCTSRSIRFDARPADVVEFFGEPGGPASTALPDVLGDPDRYVRLTRVDEAALYERRAAVKQPADPHMHDVRA